MQFPYGEKFLAQEKKAEHMYHLGCAIQFNCLIFFSKNAQKIYL
jgi:hypothetical protein